MQDDDLWRAQRKIASQNLAPRSLDEKVSVIQEAEYVNVYMWGKGRLRLRRAEILEDFANWYTIYSRRRNNSRDTFSVRQHQRLAF